VLGEVVARSESAPSVLSRWCAQAVRCFASLPLFRRRNAPASLRSVLR